MSLETKVGKRKTVNMSEDIAQELNRLANVQGKTLYSLINELGGYALEASKRGFSLEEAIRAKRLMQGAASSRMVLVNQDLWYFASSQAMKASRTKWLKLVRACAEWQSNVFVTSSSEQEFAESVRSLLKDFFWDCTKAKIERAGERGDLAMTLAFVPEMPLEHTQALFKTFEGMFNIHGYIVTDSKVGPGFMSVTFRRLGQAVSVRQR